MNSKLIEIYESKKASLQKTKRDLPLDALRNRAGEAAPLRDFKAALSRERVNVIAEIKKASPSAGILRADLEPVALAKEYAAGGAAALSVLTEEKYFKGDLSYLAKVKEAVSLPLLRKDFIFDAYQVHESLAYGADAILLIAALLDKNALRELVTLTQSLGLGCLVEVHDEKDLEKTLSAPADIIGINNRDLNDFSVDLKTAERIAAMIPEGKTIVVESGIKSAADIRAYYRKGIRAFLIGETLVRSGDVKATLKEFGGAANGG